MNLPLINSKAAHMEKMLRKSFPSMDPSELHLLCGWIGVNGARLMIGPKTEENKEQVRLLALFSQFLYIQLLSEEEYADFITRSKEKKDAHIQSADKEQAREADPLSPSDSGSDESRGSFSDLQG